MSKLTKNEIILFLEKNVHQTFSEKHNLILFNKMINILSEHYKDTDKFNQSTLDNIEQFKITRTPVKKSLLLQLKYRNGKKFQNISWTNLCKDPNSIKTKNHKISQALRYHITDQIKNYRKHRWGHAKCESCESDKDLEVDHKPPNTFKYIKNLFLN